MLGVQHVVAHKQRSPQIRHHEGRSLPELPRLRLQHSNTLKETPIERDHHQRFEVMEKVRHKLRLYPYFHLGVARTKTRAFAVWHSEVSEEDAMSANPMPSREQSLFANGIGLFPQAQFASVKLAAQKTSGLYRTPAQKRPNCAPCHLVFRANN